jgi:AraC-like DNA-binding protein
MCGTCYRVFGGGHRGHIWVFDGGTFCIVRFHVSFTEDCVLNIHIPGAFIISRYHNRFTGENAAIRMLCCCEDSDNSFSFRKGEIVSGTEIIMTGGFCKKLCCTNAGFCGGICKQFLQSEESPLYANLVRIFQQIDSCHFHATAARIYLESKALEIFALLSADCGEVALKQSGLEESFATKIRAYIEENCEAELGVDTLAKFSCMSASKCKAEFKKAFGKSVYAYITEVRMEKAKRLLSETAFNAETVALEVGYRKSGAFAAAFQKYAGQLPREYRAQQKMKYTGVAS